MATCAVSKSNANSIIVEVMKNHLVDPEEIPDEQVFNISTTDIRSSLRYFEVRGCGRFKPHVCRHSWKSVRSWCVIDLKGQIVCHKTRQMCKRCDEWVSPQYDDKELEIMVEFAVKLYLKQVGKLPRSKAINPHDSDDKKGPPHDEARCEKCIRLGHSCINDGRKNHPDTYEDPCEEQYEDCYEDQYESYEDENHQYEEEDHYDQYDDQHDDDCDDYDHYQDNYYDQHEDPYDHYDPYDPGYYDDD